MWLLTLLLGCPDAGTVRGPGAHDTATEELAQIQVQPGRLILLPGDTAQLQLVGATWDQVGVSSSDPGVVEVLEGGQLRAVDWGQAAVVVSLGQEEVELVVDVAHAEARGVWVTRWSFHSPQDIDAIMDDCQAMGANQVYLQVRGRFDAFYASDLEPWASELGALGRDPGWDPLEHAVSAAHQRGLELHAYLNTYPFWSGDKAPESEGVPHPYALHPEWVVHDEDGDAMGLNPSYVFASPGNPDVREHVIAVAADVGTRYDVDGVHLDYVRYPGPGYSHDPASLAAWGGQGDYGDWQRVQILDTLLELRQLLDVPLTAAVWGIYEDDFGWGGVSEGNLDYYQDAHAFLAQGATDANLPMTYWPVHETEGAKLDFRTLTRDHVAHAAGRHVYAGVSTHALEWEQVRDCIEVAREEGAHGAVLFEYLAVRDKGWIDDLAGGPWGEPAVLPPMDWRGE